MSAKDYIFRMIDLYLIKDDYSLTQFQLEVLDYIDNIHSSIEYDKNDKEIKIEIWKDNTEEDFYLVFNTKGNLLNSYN